METMTKEKLAYLKGELQKLKTYYHALGIMSFDFETCAPRDAREEEGETMSFFSNEAFKIATSDGVKEATVYLHEHEGELEPLDKVLVRYLYDDYMKTKNVTPETQLRWEQLENKAYIDWHDAKEASDFSKFKESLSNIVDIEKEAVSLRENALPDLYDNLLDDCEKGVLQKDLDVFFDEL
ncbi:MAG: hypothetical protein J5832_00065, partial [Clostridia bacterium]|nr:hypothetical protein [Clostridia bacterium]